MSGDGTAGRTLGLLGLGFLGLALVLWIAFGLVASGPEPDSRLVVDAPLVAAAIAGLAGVVVGRGSRALPAAVLGVSAVVLLFIWLLSSTVQLGG
jgi:hypothetical protein